ncbi:aspartyl-phosphate phosphatase Spo0E family protein [Peribacillus deserti]|uniref:Spo0A-P phosphatase n=1 Tax=Peribacillus deserti TaxID=673318 RepID=A0A2N5M1J6_9BACI|nr:aspartyl-phosphate phosphatase Spo0E family protein [Peribacillus deserti]PLT28153.1 Spo0A-P phosphatase [Peribacillus deserti]
MTKEDLLSLIENKRSELILIGSKYGLSSPLALERSQELDMLLNQYDRYSVPEELVNS